MIQYSVLGMTFTTHVDAPLITEADIHFLQEKKQSMQFSILSWKKMKFDKSKLLIKILENFYDRHNVEESERCDAETYFFDDNDKANEWLERYCWIWESAEARKFTKNNYKFTQPKGIGREV